jgi:F-type H+-transporting ATPase subunit delta
MPNETVARRYATAVFSLAKEQNAVKDVQHDLHTVAEAIDADPTIGKFFRSPVVDRNEKAEIIGRAFDKLNQIALHTVLLLVRKRREALLEEIVAQYDKLEEQARGAQTLKIETAKELSAVEIADIVRRLAASYKTAFDVKQIVNPALIGGVRITMGDRRIDGSLAGRLDEIAHLLSLN